MYTALSEKQILISDKFPYALNIKFYTLEWEKGKSKNGVVQPSFFKIFVLIACRSKYIYISQAILEPTDITTNKVTEMSKIWRLFIPCLVFLMCPNVYIIHFS